MTTRSVTSSTSSTNSKMQPQKMPLVEKPVRCMLGKNKISAINRRTRRAGENLSRMDHINSLAILKTCLSPSDAGHTAGINFLRIKPVTEAGIGVKLAPKLAEGHTIGDAPPESPQAHNGIACTFFLSRSLHLVTPQILVVQAFKPSAQLLGRWAFGLACGVQLGLLHYFVCDGDGAIRAQCQSESVRRPGIKNQGLIPLLKPQGRVKGVILKF